MQHNRSNRISLKCKRSLWSLALPLVLGLAVHSASVGAQGLRISDGSSAELSGMTSGDQLILSNHNGQIQFGGRNIDLAKFTGVIGYASEVAYVVTIAGTADTGDIRAERGRMILIPPFGGELSIARFDAARLRDKWDENIQTSASFAYAALDNLAEGQSTGIFMGRLGRTNFNVAASGLASQELAKRTIVGGDAVTKIRFDSQQNAEGLEKQIVSEFTAALAQGDAEKVAQFIDPLPFGVNDLREGADEARKLMAEALIAERNWKTALGNAPPVQDSNVETLWVVRGPVSRTFIHLRRTTDFAFVSTIRTGI